MRHRISFRAISGESNSVETEVVQNWKDTKLKELLESYSPNDLYSMDETGLLYKMTPGKTMQFKGQRCSGGKQSKEQLTLALAANVSGTDKDCQLTCKIYSSVFNNNRNRD